MRIRITRYLSGTLNGMPVWPGAEFDLPDHVGAEYVDRGYAEPIEDAPAPVETAAVSKEPRTRKRG